MAHAMTEIGRAPPVDSAPPPAAGASPRGAATDAVPIGISAGVSAGASAGTPAGIGAGAQVPSVDRYDIRPLDTAAALLILLAEVQSGLGLPPVDASRIGAPTLVDPPPLDPAQALPLIVDAFLRSVPAEDASPQLFLATVADLQRSFESALDRGLQIVSTWREATPPVVDALGVLRGTALRFLADEPPFPAIYDGPWAALQFQLDRFRRRRRRARRRLADPDFDRGARDAQTPRDTDDP